MCFIFHTDLEYSVTKLNNCATCYTLNSFSAFKSIRLPIKITHKIYQTDWNVDGDILSQNKIQWFYVWCCFFFFFLLSFYTSYYIVNSAMTLNSNHFLHILYAHHDIFRSCFFFLLLFFILSFHSNNIYFSLSWAMFLDYVCSETNFNGLFVTRFAD